MSISLGLKQGHGGLLSPPRLSPSPPSPPSLGPLNTPHCPLPSDVQALNHCKAERRIPGLEQGHGGLLRMPRGFIRFCALSGGAVAVLAQVGALAMKAGSCGWVAGGGGLREGTEVRDRSGGRLRCNLYCSEEGRGVGSGLRGKEWGPFTELAMKAGTCVQCKEWGAG